MDLNRFELMRIPVASVLFMASVFVIAQVAPKIADSTMSTVVAVLAIVVLVYSIVLFSNMDKPNRF